MAGETNTDRINKLDLPVAALLERIDRLRQQVDELGAARSESSQTIHDLDKRLALVGRDVEKLEKQLDELRSRRWDLAKLFIAAFLGSLLTVAGSYLTKSLDRWMGTGISRDSRTNDHSSSTDERLHRGGVRGVPEPAR